MSSPASLADPSVMGDLYFRSYASISVHELMLKDRSRTEAYLHAMEAHADAFIRDKIVMDVGAGTGILSLFAAKLGARKVYAVEASDMADIAESLVVQNRFADVIEVVRARVEDIALSGKVDCIVSEWMGFYLFHESMLKSVLHARDAFLKPGGLLLPTRANLYLAPVDMSPLLEEKCLFWNSVYGFDFSPVLPIAYDALVAAPHIGSVQPSQLVAPGKKIASWDLETVRAEALDCTRCAASFSAERNGLFHGFCCWFDVVFGRPDCSAQVVVLDTSPTAPRTHWMQTTVILPQILETHAGADIFCGFEMAVDEANPRQFQLSVELYGSADEAAENEGGSSSEGGSDNENAAAGDDATASLVQQIEAAFLKAHPPPSSSSFSSSSSSSSSCSPLLPPPPSSSTVT